MVLRFAPPQNTYKHEKTETWPPSVFWVETNKNHHSQLRTLQLKLRNLIIISTVLFEKKTAMLWRFPGSFGCFFRTRIFTPRNGGVDWEHLFHELNIPIVYSREAPKNKKKHRQTTLQRGFFSVFLGDVFWRVFFFAHWGRKNEGNRRVGALMWLRDSFGWGRRSFVLFFFQMQMPFL